MSRPKEAAYRLVKDQMMQDSDPGFNLASFVTTFMEKEAEDLMMEALPVNFIDHMAYPRTAAIERRCVNMLAELTNAPLNKDGQAVGTSTVGSSEAIILCMFALKYNWVNRQKAAGKDTSKPNVILSSATQVCWQKAARYADVDIRYVHCTKSRYVLEPGAAIALVDDQTIGIGCIL